MAVRLGARSQEQGEVGPPMALINPVILEARDGRRYFDGCVSFPGLYGQMTRPHYLRVTGLDDGGSRSIGSLRASLPSRFTTRLTTWTGCCSSIVSSSWMI